MWESDKKKCGNETRKRGKSYKKIRTFENMGNIMKKPAKVLKLITKGER